MNKDAIAAFAEIDAAMARIRHLFDKHAAELRHLKAQLEIAGYDFGPADDFEVSPPPPPTKKPKPSENPETPDVLKKKLDF